MMITEWLDRYAEVLDEQQRRVDALRGLVEAGLDRDIPIEQMQKLVQKELDRAAKPGMGALSLARNLLPGKLEAELALEYVDVTIEAAEEFVSVQEEQR